MFTKAAASFRKGLLNTSRVPSRGQRSTTHIRHNVHIQYDMITQFAFYGLSGEPVVGTNAIANRAYCGHRTDGTLRFD